MGEQLIVDLDTDEVLAVKLAFKISGEVNNTKSGISWGNAVWCKGKEWDTATSSENCSSPFPT
ncbi:hypothetical protein [Accumulibacter sp.]|uniref:hypothetical protein n=1 Tax=Accumulibacter sp. TaxID=2053492 RepID=UPI0025FD657B|nr:hypothetical protein [Accumulibacter sp.]MCP5228642.1 hypothetical protein [Accumulibacter sp.]